MLTTVRHSDDVTGTGSRSEDGMPMQTKFEEVRVKECFEIELIIDGDRKQLKYEDWKIVREPSRLSDLKRLATHQYEY